jgi:hypothetical protein
MKNKKVKLFVILISTMFFIVMFCCGASSDSDYENYEKHYVRYTSGPPSKPLEYYDVLRQNRIKINFSSQMDLK